MVILRRGGFGLVGGGPVEGVVEVGEDVEEDAGVGVLQGVPQVLKDCQDDVQACKEGQFYLKEIINILYI